jgi:hypothetical protein
MPMTMTRRGSTSGFGRFSCMKWKRFPAAPRRRDARRFAAGPSIRLKKIREAVAQPRERICFAVNDKNRATRRRVKPFVVVAKALLNKSIAPVEHTAGQGSISLASTGLASGLEGCYVRILRQDVRLTAEHVRTPCDQNMCTVRHRCGECVSSTQRGFFLKPSSFRPDREVIQTLKRESLNIL